ncbi:hypothetical protein M9H77_11889 [Catharanthus roseus]|uniref:Uncharacterized protein n=1 Tax=Catharanthus roseus TaxID=4058 RepID=A0ACC0BFT4_CATRO|nr:hypothetical protein M9H77_11889 [Catharanthus roseus]
MACPQPLIRRIMLCIAFHAWKSIWEAQGLLITGIRWRMGDGCSIKVWEGMVWYLFNARDAELILGLSLVPSLPADCVVLKNGGRISSLAGRDSAWKVLWNCNVPPKVKHFAYRVCSSTLPTKVNLARRGLEMDLLCPFFHFFTASCAKWGFAEMEFACGREVTGEDNAAFWRGLTGVGCGGVGVVIRDCGGRVVAAVAFQIEFVVDASYGKMLGILLGVELIKRCGVC